MSLSTISERFAKLRAMRETLCKKEEEWNEAFEAKDWVLHQLKELLAMSNNENVARVDISNRIEDLLCVLDPKGKTKGECHDE